MADKVVKEQKGGIIYTWESQTIWLLRHTYLELHPSAMGSWLIIDSRDPGTSLGEAFTLAKARAMAKSVITKNPSLWKDMG